ncbi:Uncharacterised protein [Streptococcus pyogenes]|uniref:hypothetical protein n=1 Tax=Streptococcus pyogenes TaxID=1314 RepID=UPI00109CAE65|nr:hypothetical protein [Streptococcus pyogenes]VHH05432.1 Uncharacterised protein [Streptococcus pyogenes]
MKTKSKRFLNLATLCLALLGTTLLMAQPVKAEEPKRDRVEDQEKKDDPYQKGVKDGHRAGYEVGKQDRQEKGSSDPTPPSKAPEPKSNPYKTDDDKRRYRSGWDTMYISGYYQGWYEQKDYRESDYDQHEEEGGDLSNNPSSQDSPDSTGSADSADSADSPDSTDSTDSTDDSFPDLIDMVVGIATVFWSLVSGWF